MSISHPRRRRTTVALALLTATLVPGLSQLTTVAGSAAAAPTSAAAERVTVPPGTIGDPVAGLLDVDARGVSLPSLTQKRAAARLDTASLRWNDYGTPASILPADGVLARATSADPVTAARRYLADQAAVLGLSRAQVGALELVSDQPLAMDGGHAVLFRQRFGDLRPALGSMVTVGVADGAIAYVSSSLTRTTGTPPAPRLTPLQGWLRAAADVGLDAATLAPSALTTEVRDGWTRLTVPGLVQEQQVRLRALAMADGSVRPVLEANVVDVAGGNAVAYTLMVDAVTGRVLHRQNQVENSSDAFAFSGAITPSACGPRHAFELSDARTRSIAVVANEANAANDITVKLFAPDGELLTSMDLATSPEVLTYSPGSTLPAGSYSTQVCPFDAPTTPIVPPYNYTLNVVTSDSGAATGGPTHNPRWRFFTANPTLDSPAQTPRNSVIGCWFNRSGCSLPTGQLRNVQALGPWDTLTATGLPTGTTLGNNASTREAWASPLTPGGLGQAPLSPTGQYVDPFTDAWNNSRCNPAGLVPGGNDINASVTGLFASHNRMHDFSYYLGFNERNYNMQLDNVGRGGVDNDPEVGNAQAGALTGGQPSYLGRDNANQITLQDGIPGITNQYLFQPIAGAFYAPCTDGGLDMGIVGHEYTHAISNRMVGGPDEGLTSEQGGAMGESWSDQVAAEYQFEHGYSNGGNVWAVGVYATGNKAVAIRDYAINRNPLNYSDYGFDTTGPEVHADGEIWNGVAWELRQALVRKWNSRFPVGNKSLQLKCAQGGVNKGVVRPQQCPGNRRWLQLMFDSFLLQQGATSMLDARDAFLAADQMRFRGENRTVLWNAFARRGMGKNASTAGADATSVKGGFASPTSKNAKVVFKTRGSGQVFVGDYEARVAPVADTLKSTKLKNVARFTPGTYRLLYASKKHGFSRSVLKITRGGKRTVRLGGTKNLAAAAAGAKVIGATPGSRNPAFLIDGTEATNWGGVTDGNVDATRPFVAIDLAGGVHRVRKVNVSAFLTPAPAGATDVPLLRNADPDPDSGSRFTALRRFAVEACVRGCGSASAKWKRVYTSRADAFPGVRPRPVAPNLTLRSFKIKPTRAAALRLVTLENQCTGFAGYAGELDSDPLNDTDCKTASDRGTIVHAAEFQAFG